MGEPTRTKLAEANGSPVDAEDRTGGPADWHRLDEPRAAFEKLLA